MEALQAELINLIAVVLSVCIGLITKKVMSYLKKKGLVAQLDNNKEIVRLVVNAVEQTYKMNHGEEKFNLAKMELVKIMGSKKIKISEKEIDILIEAMVKEMNETIKKEIK